MIPFTTNFFCVANFNYREFVILLMWNTDFKHDLIVLIYLKINSAQSFCKRFPIKPVDIFSHHVLFLCWKHDTCFRALKMLSCSHLVHLRGLCLPYPHSSIDENHYFVLDGDLSVHWVALLQSFISQSVIIVSQNLYIKKPDPLSSGVEEFGLQSLHLAEPMCWFLVSQIQYS